MNKLINTMFYGIGICVILFLVGIFSMYIVSKLNKLIIGIGNKSKRFRLVLDWISIPSQLIRFFVINNTNITIQTLKLYKKMCTDQDTLYRWNSTPFKIMNWVVIKTIKKNHRKKLGL